MMRNEAYQDIPDVTGLTDRDRAKLVEREDSRNREYTQEAIDQVLRCIDQATLARCKSPGS